MDSSRSGGRQTPERLGVRMEKLGRIRLGFVVVLGALLGALFIAAHVSAAVSGTLAVGSATIAPGDVGTVSVTASAPSPGLGAWSVDVSVQDPSHVSIVSCVAESHSVCNAQYRTSPTDGQVCRSNGDRAGRAGHVGHHHVSVCQLGRLQRLRAGYGWFRRRHGRRPRRDRRDDEPWKYPLRSPGSGEHARARDADERGGCPSAYGHRRFG